MLNDRQKLDKCRLTLAFIADRLDVTDSLTKNEEWAQVIIDKIDVTIKETAPTK